VRVEHERRVLPLPYALQTVSDVAGELLPTATPLAVLAALHPGGSVTGAPKPAALAMIGELETGPRGAYCGTLGVRDGERSVFGLLIRTAERGAGGWEYGVGSGVVYDSDPARELDELRVKLGALGCPIRCYE
jgi:anthranilate/para-aminobenzoate synthase component I